VNPDTEGPVVCYVGWHGRRNLGDDAIYDAVRLQLGGATFLDLPNLPRERLLAAATGLNRRLRRGALVVGGGTVIGRRNWRSLIERGLSLTKSTQGYAIGIGVEDPVFSGHRSYSDNDELGRWVPALSRFRTLSVRGPRSAELLAGIGVEARVSGDPALLLPRPNVAAEDGLIGVNVGYGDDLWGHDPAAVASEIAGAIRKLSASGHRFRGILMNPEDRGWTQTALHGVEADLVLPDDPIAAAQELARCSVIIVTRLHAAILASLSETPVVALEYQPKCRDFALSIQDERSLIRTDQVTSGALVERVQTALADSANIRMTTRAAVDALQQRLRAEYAYARGELGLER
jgi:hypothetical protein